MSGVCVCVCVCVCGGGGGGGGHQCPDTFLALALLVFVQRTHFTFLLCFRHLSESCLSLNTKEVNLQTFCHDIMQNHLS